MGNDAELGANPQTCDQTQSRRALDIASFAGAGERAWRGRARTFVRRVASATTAPAHSPERCLKALEARLAEQLEGADTLAHAYVATRVAFMPNRSVVHPPLEALGWTVLRDWRRLDHVMQGIFDCPHSTPKLTGTGPYVVRSQDIRTGVVRVEQMARVSEETYMERVARAEPVRGDVLYSREGTLLRHCSRDSSRD